MESKTKKAPEKTFRAGPVSVNVWQNQATLSSGEQSTFQTVSVARSYKDKDGNWQSTSSLRPNDVPKTLVALQKAYEYLVCKEEGVMM